MSCASISNYPVNQGFILKTLAVIAAIPLALSIISLIGHAHYPQMALFPHSVAIAGLVVCPLVEIVTMVACYWKKNSVHISRSKEFKPNKGLAAQLETIIQAPPNKKLSFSSKIEFFTFERAISLETNRVIGQGPVARANWEKTLHAIHDKSFYHDNNMIAYLSTTHEIERLKGQAAPLVFEPLSNPNSSDAIQLAEMMQVSYQISFGESQNIISKLFRDKNERCFVTRESNGKILEAFFSKKVVIHRKMVRYILHDFSFAKAGCIGLSNALDAFLQSQIRGLKQKDCDLELLAHLPLNYNTFFDMLTVRCVFLGFKRYGPDSYLDPNNPKKATHRSFLFLPKARNKNFK